MIYKHAFTLFAKQNEKCTPILQPQEVIVLKL